MPTTIADVAHEIVNLAGITSIIDFWHEWMLLDATLPAEDHGRLDIVFTAEEARARAAA
jgi:hypothetical protein